jgi:hypothetical protein
MDKIAFSYFLKDHSLVKEKQPSRFYFSFFQLNKKSYWHLCVLTVSKACCSVDQAANLSYSQVATTSRHQPLILFLHYRGYIGNS